MYSTLSTGSADGNPIKSHRYIDRQYRHIPGTDVDMNHTVLWI